MSTPLMIAVTCAYLWTAGEQLYLHYYGYAVMFFAYALANCGFLYHLRYETAEVA